MKSGTRITHSGYMMHDSGDIAESNISLTCIAPNVQSEHLIEDKWLKQLVSVDEVRTGTGEVEH